MPIIDDLKSLLSILNYDDIDLVGFDRENNIVYFDAMLDTYYRIQCLLFVDGTIEVHDTTFDFDNYVKIADARKVSDKWMVTYN